MDIEVISFRCQLPFPPVSGRVADAVARAVNKVAACSNAVVGVRNQAEDVVTFDCEINPNGALKPVLYDAIAAAIKATKP